MKSITEIKSIAWDKLCERKWAGPIIVSMFSVLLSISVQFFSLITSTNNLLATLLLHLCLYICIVYPFSMGLKIYMLRFIRGEEVSVGNVFDGYMFAIKMIPLSFLNLGVSVGINFTAELAGTGNLLMMAGGAVILILLLLVSCVMDFSLYLIYDNNGKAIKSFLKVALYMLKGGIVKYILLGLSYILWFVGILITAGMLSFFVYPYLEASKTVLYEEVKNFLRSDI